MELICRADAKKLGLKRFYTGEPCIAGHICERQTINGACIECRNIRVALSKAKKPQHYKRLRKEHYRTHQEEMKAEAKLWRQENLERAAETKRNYYLANSREIYEKTRAYKLANLDWHRETQRKWAEANRDKVRERARESEKRYPARKNANRRKYQAAKMKRVPVWADLDAIRAIYAEARRLTEETGIPHHVDHIYPLQGKFVSGLHVETNLQILSARENIAKGNRVALDEAAA